MVIHNADDLALAEMMAKSTGDQMLLLMQPGRDIAGGKHVAVEHVRRYPRWLLSLQTHKWLGMR